MILSEQDLNELNEYVYNVDEKKHKNKKLIKPDEGMIIRLKSGITVYVVSKEDHRESGFQGLAVAPIVNGKPDYTQITVAAAGTDIFKLNDLGSAINSRTKTSDHFKPAEVAW